MAFPKAFIVDVAGSDAFVKKRSTSMSCPVLMNFFLLFSAPFMIFPRKCLFNLINKIKTSNVICSAHRGDQNQKRPIHGQRQTSVQFKSNIIAPEMDFLSEIVRLANYFSAGRTCE